MKYEGKLYGKIAGKYIEVTDHVSNEKLIEILEKLVVDCKERATEFLERKMVISETSSMAMAIAYQNVIDILNGENS